MVLAAVAVIARGGDDPAHLGTTAPPSTIGCIGDCDGDGRVTVAELVRGVRIAIGAAATADCPAIDSSEDGSVTVAELTQAVNRLLNGCQRICAAEPSNTLVACTDPLSRRRRRELLDHGIIRLDSSPRGELDGFGQPARVEGFRL